MLQTIRAGIAVALVCIGSRTSVRSLVVLSCALSIVGCGDARSDSGGGSLAQGLDANLGATGELDVQATLNTCPVLDGLSAIPAVVSVGGVSSLFVEAHDSDGAPAALTYSWFVNGSPLARPTTPAFGFRCSSVGPVVIAASISDGSCADGARVQVSCE